MLCIICSVGPCDDFNIIFFFGSILCADLFAFCYIQLTRIILKGDIQNFAEEMSDKEFEEYSLENTLKILLKHYPKSNIYLIR